MQLKNRLRKLEKQIDVSATNSDFCGCERQTIVRLPGDPPIPETCESCGKPLFIIYITSAEMREENK
ncbi:hypothetical protein BH10ACI1_BH10ACI1_19350 [soil metagenome]